MGAFRRLVATCALLSAMLLQAGAPGHTAFAEPPCHEAHTITAKNGQPCGDHAAAADMACCLSASCVAPAWAPSASAACPQPSWRPAAASAELREGGDGILLRPVLPPPRTA